MASANVSSDSSEGAAPTKPRACPPPVKAAASDRRATEVSGCRRPVFEPPRDLLLDRSALAAPAGLDQATLGDEPQPMLPGLEGC